MKIDLHVHTKYSTRPSQWILQKIGCPESFVEPAHVYAQARAKGMDMVTISDHNVIDGGLEIAHLPQTFVSEEISVFFPEDKCKVHVLAWDIDERIHNDVQPLRDNLYDLVAYLRQEKVRHAIAHPLFAVNDKLRVEHVEKLLLLFNTFESNGTRDGMQNSLLENILTMLNEPLINRLRELHDIEPLGPTPWLKAIVGGSDDHSGLNIARMHTEVPGVTTLDAFFEGIAGCDSMARGHCSTPKTMAHNLYSIGYQFFKDKYGLQSCVNKDNFLKFLDLSLTSNSPEPQGVSGLWIRFQAMLRNSGLFRGKRINVKETSKLLRHKAEKVFESDPKLTEKARTLGRQENHAEQLWFDYVNKSTNEAFSYYANTILDHLTSADIFGGFQSIASAGALYTALSPYFVAYTLFTKDRAFCRESLLRIRELAGNGNKPIHGDGEPPFKLAHFTDTFFDMNGVAITLREHVSLARCTGKEYTVITCDHADQTTGGDYAQGVMNFKPIGAYDMPEYPDLKLLYPPILEMLSYVYEQGFTDLHAATPGPIGLAALLISRILKLPISGTYHTAFPQYIGTFTGDTSLEDATWKFMIWFYNQMDRVYCPSQAFKDELAAKGIPEERLVVYPRGVDTERFTPLKRNGFFEKYNLNGNTKLLYVGRISKEKNMPVLEGAIRELLSEMPKLDVVLVGDGPYREEMQANLKDLNCVFTGKLEGEELAAAYASSDLFVFPSTTDTFGKVILEAQASGLPVIVTNVGGPKENLVPGKTGLIVEGNNPESLKNAIYELVSEPGLAKLRNMGSCARDYCVERTLHKAFESTWNLYSGRE